MTEQLATLAPEQAQRALVLFYEQLPKDLWKDGKKPTWVDNQALAEDLTDQSPAEVQHAIAAIQEKEQAQRGEVARMLLREFAKQEALRPFVERAVGKAATPQMAVIDPLTISAALVVLASLPKITRDENGKWNLIIDPAGNATRLIDRLAEFVKVLPSGFWK